MQVCIFGIALLINIEIEKDGTMEWYYNSNAGIL